jgi:hypothetical protein
MILTVKPTPKELELLCGLASNPLFRGGSVDAELNLATRRVERLR